jgi:hypothetical protein
MYTDLHSCVLAVGDERERGTYGQSEKNLQARNWRH